MSFPRANIHRSVSHSPDKEGIAIQVSALTKRYLSISEDSESAVTALDNVSLALEHGRFTAIMGPSGSGKSTLLHCIAGLDLPTSGSVIVDRVEITSLKRDELTAFRGKQIGFVFQAFNLLPMLTAEENIELTARLAKVKIDRSWLNELCQALGLADRLTHRPSQLSGGQQQRVAVARALLTRPAVVFADEPTGNLDSKSTRDVLGFLRAAVDNYGQTVVMVTHDPKAAAMTDRVLILADGRIVHDIEKPTLDQVNNAMNRLEDLVAGRA